MALVWTVGVAPVSGVDAGNLPEDAKEGAVPGAGPSLRQPSDGLGRMTLMASGAAVAILLLAAVACDETPVSPTRAALAQPFDLEVGDRALIEGETLTVAFTGVEADSRCPVDVICVWEGDAVVLGWAEREGAFRAAIELHTSSRFPQQATYQAYGIHLLALSPAPRAGRPVDARDYVATVLVLKD